MNRLLPLLGGILFSCISYCQTTKNYFSSADILQDIQKLKVFGNVLYIAAHPDDENTRLLAYLANEKKYRTGYLSLTRGDGGQNLIGDEQGVELGLIRTQELLAARRIDGAEQFFSTAYDFGYSKSPAEAIEKWGHDKILSDVVWVIRNFKPDVIITRFPTTGEGGHGHHTASAILAGEAFEAAADPNKFPEQLKNGVTAWQTKRLLWNTFNFGGNNTTREDQLKINVGGYNPILGKSYGEIASESRSQHKSQGFGVAAQRGDSYEYFSTIKGEAPRDDLMSDIITNVKKVTEDESLAKKYEELTDKALNEFNAAAPERSIPVLQEIDALLSKMRQYRKRTFNTELIAKCAGIFMEVNAAKQLNVVGDSLPFTVTFNNRSGAPIESVLVTVLGIPVRFNKPAPNANANQTASTIVQKETPPTQPYWLEYPMQTGAFVVKDQQLIGKAENDPLYASFEVFINGKSYQYKRPIIYKYTDPVKGELYEPVQLVSPAFVNVAPSLLIFPNDQKKKKQDSILVTIQANKDIKSPAIKLEYDGRSQVATPASAVLQAGTKSSSVFMVRTDSLPTNSIKFPNGNLASPELYENQLTSLKKISYDHIPDIFYNYQDRAKVLRMDLNIIGKKVGYIEGAGDKVPQALQQMGYEVVMLGAKDITLANLSQLDAIVTGVRAYNTNPWLSEVYDVMMKYVEGGGVLLVQYNTNNSVGPVRAKISPYSFTITRNRITDENADVKFLLPDHPALNYPNKITAKDFEGWIQERSIYHAENTDSHYQKLLSMHDPGENDHDGSLIVTNYGKGKFVYTGIVFFRELPAGVPGAYRLFANLIANPKK